MNLKNIYIILVEPKNEENIGSVARVMKNFGIKNLVLVNPRCKLTYESFIVSVYANDILESAIILKRFEDLRILCDSLYATSAKITKSTTKKLRKFIFPWEIKEELLYGNHTIGIVFGREDNGLTNKEIRFCDHLIHIPTSNEYPALNLSHSVAVICYEIFKTVSKRELQSEQKHANYEEKLYLINKILDKWNLPEEKKRYIERMLLRAPMYFHEVKKALEWLKD